jgi:hypothetical protein
MHLHKRLTLPVGRLHLEDTSVTKMELWIGRVEVLTPATDSGNTKTFTNVITWASERLDFEVMVAHVFEEYGWALLGVEECGPVRLRNEFDEEFLEAIELAKGNLNACIYTTFHYYPSKAH